MEKLQGAVIGFGLIAEKGHWPTYALSPDAEIVAVVDPSPERRAAAHVLKPGLRTYASADELFRTEKVHFVDICTPPGAHAQMVLSALAQGAHVLCEKPLVLSEKDYLNLKDAAERTHRTLCCVHNWSHAPIIQKALDLIQNGRIGRVWHTELFVLRDQVCAGTDAGKTQGDWRRDPAISGGGIIVDHGWHAFYLLQKLINAEPESILAKMIFAEDGSGLDEAVQAILQFPEADAYMHLSWRAKMRRNAINIQGTEGTLLIDDDRLLLTDRGGLREEHRFEALSAGSHHADWFQGTWLRFLSEIRLPAQRGSNLREAGWCVSLTRAAYASNLQGFKSQDVLFPGTAARTAALTS